MTGGCAQHLIAAGVSCGVLAAWLTGLFLHLRLSRLASGGHRSVVRVSLPLDRDAAIAAIVRGLGASPHVIARLEGRLEDALIGSARPARLWPGGREAARISCRLEDVDGETGVRCALDFSPMTGAATRISQAILFLVWPAWIAAVTVAILATILSSQAPAWVGLYLAHAVYPLFALVGFHLLHRHHRATVEDAITSVLESLRFLPGG